MRIFGTKDAPGEIVSLTQTTLDTWKKLGQLSIDVDPKNIISWDYVGVQ
jgi:hypothetical protein